MDKQEEQRSNVSVRNDLRNKLKALSVKLTSQEGHHVSLYSLVDEAIEQYLRTKK